MDIVISPGMVALNTHLGAQSAAAPVRAPAPPDPAVADATTPPDILAAAIRTLAAQQAGLPALLADAIAALGAPTLPQAIRIALAQLLALRPQLDGITADGLMQAVARSGLFLEAFVAKPTTPLPVDFKVALLALRDILKTWLDTQPARPVLSPPTAPHGEAGHVETRSPDRAIGPPPPYRGGPLAAQPLVGPSIDPDAAPADIGRALLTEVDGALARQTLLQAASLPDRSAHENPTTARWNFEIPFVLAQGTALAQFEIARDGHHAPNEPTAPIWRVRFSLDFEPLGPVHAQIALFGTRASVNLWAERASTASALGDAVASLSNGLRQAALDPGDVRVLVGEPPRPQQERPAGRFLDRAS